MSSVTKEPRKKPPVPESLGSLVSKVGQTVCCCVTWQRDNWVLPHAWHHEVTSRTWRDFTSFTNSSSSHVSLHSGMLYFTNGPWGEKNSILKPYYYHFSRSQSFAKTHGKKPSTWLSAILTFVRQLFDVSVLMQYGHASASQFPSYVLFSPPDDKLAIILTSGKSRVPQKYLTVWRTLCFVWKPKKRHLEIAQYKMRKQNNLRKIFSSRLQPLHVVRHWPRYNREHFTPLFPQKKKFVQER